MRRYAVMLVTTLGAMLVAVPAFAQAEPVKAAGMDTATWVAITSGFAMAIVAAVCGYAQSKAAVAACEGLARNPGARPGIQLALILALIFIESLALYTLLIIVIKVVVPRT